MHVPASSGIDAEVGHEQGIDSKSDSNTREGDISVDVEIESFAG